LPLLTVQAQNPKQQAFFHAIEDFQPTDGLDWLFHEDSVQVLGSQIDSQDQSGQNEAQHVPSLKRKISDVIVTSSAKENLVPETENAGQVIFKKPKLSDIREQLSFLTEDSIIPDSQRLFSDDEEDLEQELLPHFLTRTDTSLSTDSNGSRASIVNRLHRKNEIEEEESRPLAFSASGAKHTSQFKIPSLLRRATNLSTTSESSTTGTSQGSNERSVRQGGSKKSNIHYQSYAAEKRKVVDAAESKRKAQLKRTVMSAKGRSIISVLRNSNHGFE
jgi:mediator of replication checkpoint protein 1